MNITEFKAWFEGFSENIDETPTPEQFEKIKAKIAELTPEHPRYPLQRDKPEIRWAPHPVSISSKAAG